MSYGDYVQREIFTPLGMTHSSASTNPAGDDVLAEGHRFWFGVPIAAEPTRREATLAAGYLISTADDLGRYLSMYLADGLAPDGTRIVSADDIRTLLAAGPDAVLGSWAQGQDSRYAMGWFVGGPWGEDAVFHPGNTPDTTTMLALFPERALAVAVVVNAGNELPVPGNPFIADRVTRNVVHAALGQPAVDLPSVWRFYAVFDLVVLILLGAAAWGLSRAVRAVKSPGPSVHRGRSWAGVLLRGVGVGLLVLLPMSSYGWGGLWTWAPDLAVAIITLTLLLALATALRVTGLVRGPTRPRATPHRKEARPCIRLRSSTSRNGYGREVVVDDLSFTVAPARVTGFLGPNGAGKSTTMKILLDLADADSGHASIACTRYRDLEDPARTVGVVLEPNAFHPGRSGRNHLRILADGSGIPPARIDELLEMVELSHAADRPVGGYSLGMRQRLGIAAAMLGDPPVLVLDEPGNGLDPQGIRWLRDLLRARAAAGGTIFVSSHLSPRSSTWPTTWS